MTNLIKKIKLNLSLFFNGIFRGLKRADIELLAQKTDNNSNDQIISHQLEINSVYNDLLQEKKTEEVLETIDMSYRIAREADKYEVTLIGDLSDDSVNSENEESDMF
jgi:hypothetical protein